MGFGGTAVVVGGATIAGFFAAACSLPFDYVKTQMQKMKPDPVTGAVPYTVSLVWWGVLPVMQTLLWKERCAGTGCRAWPTVAVVACSSHQTIFDHNLPHCLQNSIDCALKTLRSKGPLGFYTGFPTYVIRIAPHAALTLVFVAWLPKVQSKIGM
jgi:solute carrier family 25 oxoglutarate transporter 11